MSTELVLKPVLDYVKAELIVNCIIVFITLSVVTLRVVGRCNGPGLWWDDYFVLLATPLGVGMLVCQGLCEFNPDRDDPERNGYNLEDNPELAVNVPRILELTFGMQVLYVILLAAVKASMLCLFLRVFVTEFVQRASKILLGFVLAWAIAYLCACVFLCTPISGQWTGQGKCGAYMPMIQSLITTNAVGDLVIMAIPMHSVWKLQMRSTEKLGIMATFALGLACVVCAIFRLIYISSVDLNKNITGTMPTTIFLFILEPNLAILCVSIPMLRPFYAKYRKRMGGSKLNETDEQTSAFQQSRTGGMGSKSRMTPAAAEPGAMWEMEEYYPADKARKNEPTVVAYGDESGSEKNLTSPSMTAKDEIRVQKEWTVTHN
ncbi:hypothetical protein HJFPF1_00172 [Paramyrothecium foliicola]|nr:hypothetical protein HJFPF1_00172 [Paramyrothecium foliicola]